MTYEIYRYIFIGAAVACGVMAAVSVILFFTLNIPKVIGDLSGRTAKKAIENIRRQNEQSGDKTYKSSAVNLERGKLTDKISPSGRVVPRGDNPFGTGVITQKISTQELPMQEGVGETMPLNRDDGTALLNPEMGQTAPLYREERQAAPKADIFEVEFEITYIHSDEVIV